MTCRMKTLEEIKSMPNSHNYNFSWSYWGKKIIRFEKLSSVRAIVTLEDETITRAVNIETIKFYKKTENKI